MARKGRGRLVLTVFVCLAAMLAVDGAVSEPGEALRPPFSVPEAGGGGAAVDYIRYELGRHRTGLSAAEEMRLAEVIAEESSMRRLDPLLVLAVIKTESTFYNWSRSRKGARGLMQLRPRTGRYVAKEFDLRWSGPEALYDPFLNVRLGIHYLSKLRERYDDDLKALAAYNFGPGRISRRIRRGAGVPERYARKVFAYYREFQERARYF